MNINIFPTKYLHMKYLGEIYISQSNVEQTFTVNRLLINISGLVDHMVSFAATQMCSLSGKAATGNM